MLMVDPGGPVVIILATGSEVRGFKPRRWPRVVDLRHVKEPQPEIRAPEQICRLFTLNVESDVDDLRC